jgi:hypothetical protein
MNYKDTTPPLQVKEQSALTRAKPEQRGEARSALGSTYVSSSQKVEISKKQIQNLSLTRNNSYFFQDNLRQIIHNEHVKGSDHRLCSCGVVPVQQFMKIKGESGIVIESPVSLRRDKSGAAFTGLAKCKNPFYCPVCAPVVLIDKSNEIKSIVSNFLDESENHTTLMVTSTLSHTIDDQLKDLIKVVTGVNGSLKSARFRKDLESRFGFFSSIRAIESTYSDVNGWHPHLHEIWFFKKKLNVSDVLELKEVLYKKYLSLLEKKGYTASSQRGIDISFSVTEGTKVTKYSTSTKMPKDNKSLVNSSSSAALYVAKFDKELTFEFTKIQKLTNLSFFGLLARYSYETNSHDKKLILEFVDAVFRQRRINVPANLKAYLTDVELVEDYENNKPVIFTFSRKEWLQVCFRKQRQAIIAIANNQNYSDDFVCKYIRAVLDQPHLIIPPDEYKFLNKRRVADLSEWDWVLNAA